MLSEDEAKESMDKRIQERNNQGPGTPQAALNVDDEDVQENGTRDLKTMLENRLTEMNRRRQQAKREKQLLEESCEETPVTSSMNGTQDSPDLNSNRSLAGNVGDSSSPYHGVMEPLRGSGDVHMPSDDSNDGLDHDVVHTSMTNVESDLGGNTSGQDGRQEDYMKDQERQSPQSATATHPSMTPQEKKWWSMSFEELYEHARSKDYGKHGKESRKSGRIRIIKWLCEKEGITPYVAPTVPPVEATPIIERPTLRPTGAISHPEAILRTSDPELQRLIDEKEKSIENGQLLSC